MSLSPLVALLVLLAASSAHAESYCGKPENDAVLKLIPDAKIETLTKSQFYYALGIWNGQPPIGRGPDDVDGAEIVTSPDGKRAAVLFTLGPLLCGGIAPAPPQVIEMIRKIDGGEL